MPLELNHPAWHPVMTQVPPEQATEATCAFSTHTTPQFPQLETLVAVLISQPFEYTLSQFLKPALQDATVQVPLTQPAVPLATAHRWPQAPQLPMSVLVLISHPLATTLSQFAQPALQLAMVQEPFTHAGVPLTMFAQTFPQAPQLETLVSRLISQPFAELLSQLA